MTSEEMSTLVTLCGGTVTKDLKAAHVILVSKDSMPEAPIKNKKVIDWRWVTDSIRGMKVLEVEGYTLQV